jgi:hypothetical protein
MPRETVGFPVRGVCLSAAIRSGGPDAGVVPSSGSFLQGKAAEGAAHQRSRRSVDRQSDRRESWERKRRPVERAAENDSAPCEPLRYNYCRTRSLTSLGLWERALWRQGGHLRPSSRFPFGNGSHPAAGLRAPGGTPGIHRADPPRVGKTGAESHPRRRHSHHDAGSVEVSPPRGPPKTGWLKGGEVVRAPAHHSPMIVSSIMYFRLVHAPGQSSSPGLSCAD